MEKLPSPKEYANKLIDSYFNSNIVYDMDYDSATSFSLIDVENTIKFCTETVGKHFELTPEFDFLNSVLTILKEKL